MNRCWCGVRNPYFSDEPHPEGCGGMGFLDCFCGGDLCVCHYHGEIPCDGCEDCAGDEEGLYDAAVHGMVCS